MVGDKILKVERQGMRKRPDFLFGIRQFPDRPNLWAQRAADVAVASPEGNIDNS